jgi:hypothetical protein
MFSTGTWLVHATAMTALGSVFTLTSTSRTQHRSAQFSTVTSPFTVKKVDVIESEGEKAKKASVSQVRIRDFLVLPDPLLYFLYGFVSGSFNRIRIWILQSDSYLDPSIRKQKRKKKKPDFDRTVASK